LTDTKDAKVYLVCGRRGSGKTTRARALCHRARRVVCFDPMREYGHLGFREVHTLSDLRAAMRWAWRGGFRIAYVPIGGNEIEALHHLSRFLWRVQRPYEVGADPQKLTLIVEEMSLSFPARPLSPTVGGFVQAVNQGRHVGLDIIGVTQRPAEVSGTFRGNAAEIYIFPLAAAIDRQSILQILGREYGEALRQLQPHSYLKFADGEVTKGRNRLGK